MCAFISSLPHRAEKITDEEIESIIDRLDMSGGDEDVLHEIIEKLTDDLDAEELEELEFNKDESDILEAILERCREDECIFTKSYTA